jgi:GNAT superfamily N-acetyltransferase
MKNIIKVRKAIESDSEVLIQFNIAMAFETEQKILPRELIDPGVRALFRKSEYGFYLVAEIDGQIAGSLMITYEWSDWRNGLFWWIQSVYVKPEYRRLGVYRALYTSVKNSAQQNTEVCG